MTSRTACVSVCVLSSAFVFPMICSVAAQDGMAERGIVELIEADARIGQWVFYHQRYLNGDNQWAEYRGSVYAAINQVKIAKCRIEMQTVVVDKFTGTVGKIAKGEQQDGTFYEIAFTLTRPIAQTMEIVEARPSQLRKATHSTCDDKPSCELTWVRFRSPEQKISERISTNDQTEFAGATSTAVFPVSSPDVGSKAIRELRLLANSGCP